MCLNLGNENSKNDNFKIYNTGKNYKEYYVSYIILILNIEIEYIDNRNSSNYCYKLDISYWIYLEFVGLIELYCGKNYWNKMSKKFWNGLSKKQMIILEMM